MNALSRDIADGEVVVLQESVMTAAYKDLKWRLVSVHGGFGQSGSTRGTALLCKHLEDGEEARWSGTDIDVAATKTYQDGLAFGKSLGTEG